MYTINKRGHTKKKSGNLFNDPRIYIYIYMVVYKMHVQTLIIPHYTFQFNSVAVYRSIGIGLLFIIPTLFMRRFIWLFYLFCWGGDGK